MALNAADVTKLILIYIGGKMLFPVINARIGGGTTTCQGPPTFFTRLGDLAKGVSAIADTVESTISSITEPIDKIQTAVANVTSAVDKLSSLAENPVGYIQNEVKTKLQDYSYNNGEGLDNTCTGIKAAADADPVTLGPAWTNLKNAFVNGTKKVFRYSTHTDSVTTGGSGGT